MTEPTQDTQTPSDAELVEGARAGDQRAFAELWSRHHQAGIRVARHWTSLDAEDVVSEAFMRIYRAIRGGGGPRGAFRPYLYATVRNIAASWGAALHDVAVEDVEEYAPADIADPAAVALDRTLTARAFRSLPERWQSVLWYTEVEGMDPHEVAPILGMSANGVAALSYRAREGLRKAWLQAHISDATAHGECKWALSRLPDRARHSLSARDAERMDFHLATCAHCAIVSEELEEVGSRLASVLMPLILGGGAGGALLLAFADGGTAASAATAASLPPIPDLVGAGAAGATGAAGASGAIGSVSAAVGVAGGIAGAVSGPAAVVGSLALAFTLAGTAVVVAPAEPWSTSVSQQGSSGGTDGGSAPQSGSVADPVLGLPSDPPDAGDSLDSGVGGVVGGVVEGVDDLTDAVVDTITGGSTPPPGHSAPGGIVGGVFDVTLSGSGTPGALLSLQAAGQIYATTTVAADGTFTITATALPDGLASLELVQHVDRTYLATLLPGGGALEKILGTLDGLIDALVRPLQLSAGDSRVTVVLID